MQDKQENQDCGITIEEAIKNKELLSEAVRRYNIIQSYLLTPEKQDKEILYCLTNLLINTMDSIKEVDTEKLNEVKQLLKLFHLLNEVN